MTKLETADAPVMTRERAIALLTSAAETYSADLEQLEAALAFLKAERSTGHGAQKIPVCACCLSADISSDALARFNRDTMTWEMSGLLDNTDCEDCAGECSIVELEPGLLEHPWCVAADNPAQVWAILDSGNILVADLSKGPYARMDSPAEDAKRAADQHNDWLEEQSQPDKHRVQGERA